MKLVGRPNGETSKETKWENDETRGSCDNQCQSESLAKAPDTSTASACTTSRIAETQEVEWMFLVRNENNKKSTCLGGHYLINVIDVLQASGWAPMGMVKKSENFLQKLTKKPKIPNFP